MRLGWTKSKNTISYYVYKSIYKNGIRTTKLVEKLGTEKQICEKYNTIDAKAWAKKYIEELNIKEKERSREIIVRYLPSKDIPVEEQQLFNCGYLFLQAIYYQLGLHKICRAISKKYAFEFDLNAVFSRLIYSRILFPSSKLATNDIAKKFLEQPSFELQHIYRSLTYISKEKDYIQSTLYKNSLKIANRKTGVIFYDCTNYFFEVEEEQNLKQYGISKEHRPNPIVQMGLFMDAEGIPLAFSINPGNTNEQTTLKPLEEKLLSDFSLSEFIVCTDAGLSSLENRKFNTKNGRSFVTTQSLKTLKEHLQKWALDPNGWFLSQDSKNKYNIYDLDENINKDKVFYKERWINEKGLEQHLIVSYSLKYRNYQKNIRIRQIERALKAINTPSKLNKTNSNDYKRFITKKTSTRNGEIAETTYYEINQELYNKEAQFDGFYASCTNLEDSAETIIRINHRRWEIEECFRIMKSEFKARPVYLQQEDRIYSHFMICFISLIVYRYLENKLENKYTINKILSCLKEMNLFKVMGEGYVPTYTRTDISNELHAKFGFRTDSQIIPTAIIKNICSSTKK